VNLNSLLGFARYARGLSQFLAEPLSEREAYRMISANLSSREQRFLTLLKRGVFGIPHSPYRALFGQAGIQLEDVALLVRTGGLESALSQLYDAGVWLSLAESKGKEPIRRGGREIHSGPLDLHNRGITRHFEGSTGGSRSSGTRFWVDLGDVLDASTYAVLTRKAFGLENADAALWLPAPPGVAGMRRALWWSKAGTDVRRWFAQSVPHWASGDLKRAAFIRWTLTASRLAGRPLPAPEHTPTAEAGRVARWLAEAVRTGRPAVLFGTPSTGVRVCEAAADAGLDIAGTFFSFGGEPYTDAKDQVIRSARCRAESGYYISEYGGPVALGCANAGAVDTAHLAEDRVAVIEKPRTLASGGSVQSLLVTSISPLTPQIAINVETGDYAVHGQAGCGCPFALAGLTRTLHTIRSYDKLTTEGMHFVGPDLITLLEEVLPRRFGGGPTDYQLVEEEDEHGHSRVHLIVSPGVGQVDEGAIVEAAIAFLRVGGPAESMMADIWSSGDALRLVRREPEASQGGKVLSLHIRRTGSRS
jgi:hypothetical protein